MTNYAADPDDFIKAFPERIAKPPELLLDFAGWLRDRPWGAVGSFDLTAGWSDDLIFGGERFHEDFALFMRLPDGSCAGYWLRDGAAPETAPIVLLGSEGEFETLGQDLPNFLMRLAAADFLESAAQDLLPNFDDEGDAPKLRDEFAEWVSRQMGLRDIGGFFKGRFQSWLSGKLDRPPTDAFLVWAETEGRAPELEQESDPRIAALSALLEPYRPGPDEWEWARTSVSICWAGDHVEIVDASHGHRPLPEHDAMLPLLAALRDGEAERTPGVGLWSQAWLKIGRDGPASLGTDYRFEPRFFLGRPADEAFRADQNRSPRTARRIPDWLEPILRG